MACVAQSKSYILHYAIKVWDVLEAPAMQIYLVKKKKKEESRKGTLKNHWKLLKFKYNRKTFGEFFFLLYSHGGTETFLTICGRFALLLMGSGPILCCHTALMQMFSMQMQELSLKAGLLSSLISCPCVLLCLYSFSCSLEWNSCHKLVWNLL